MRAAAVMVCNCKASFGMRGRATVHEKGVIMMSSRLLLMMRDKMLLTIMTVRRMRDDKDVSAAETFGSPSDSFTSFIDEGRGSGSQTSRDVAAAAERSDSATYAVSAAAAWVWNMVLLNARNCTVHAVSKE